MNICRIWGGGGDGGRGVTRNRTAIVQGGLPSNTTSHLAELGKDGSGMIWPHLEDTTVASKFCVRVRQVGQEEHSECTYKNTVNVRTRRTQ